ncbi:MAG TPA: DUF2934 domain-containing protein [bacterium]|jgi:hypothetical protein|nr:DUF2934 domain-containing protein [bacterium]
MIDYSDGMIEVMEKGQSDHFLPLGQPTLLEVLVGRQQMGPFNNSEAVYHGIEKRKPLMRPVHKTASGDLGNQLEIAAYYLWQSRGCPFNDPEADWLEAERQWLSRAKSA